MKIRTGFVSNSSSSSFVCDYCGQDVSGYDMSLRDAEMYRCVNGHTLCEDHLPPMDDRELLLAAIKEKIVKYQARILAYPEDTAYPEYVEAEQVLLAEIEADADYECDDLLEDYEVRYELPAQFCPICQLEKILDVDMKFYLLRKLNLTQDQVSAEIKQSFPTYQAFMDYLTLPEKPESEEEEDELTD